MTRQNKTTRIIFVLALGFVLLLSVLSYIRINSLIQSGQLVNHTSVVSLELETLKGNLKNAEIGQHGFLLTHDSRFIFPFYKGLKDYPRNLANLHELIKDNPVQEENLRQLSSFAKRRMDRLQEVLEIDKTRPPTPAELLIEESISDSINNKANEMIGNENKLLQQRTEQLQMQKFLAPVMLFIFSLFALAILTLSYIQLNKSLQAAQQLRKETIEQAILLTETKRIQVSEKRFRGMVEQAPVAICILRGENFVVEVANQKMLEIWGKSKEQVLDKPVFEGMPEAAGQGFEELLDGVFTTGKPYVANELLLSLIRNGKKEDLYIDFVYTPLYDGDKIEGVLTVATEVSDQVIYHKKIEESEARFRNLIFSSPSAIGILYGEDHVITIANDPIIAIWGKGKEIIGKAYFEALPELAEQGYKEVFAQVYKTGIPFNAIETPVHILQDGVTTLKYYNFILYPQYDINNKVNGIGIIATEVTSQALLNNKIKESEQRYRELSLSLEEKVNQRTEELNFNNIELQKMNKELQSFAYISSHDLQEPLRKIQTFASLIIEREEKNLSESGKDNFKRMQDAAKRMQTLINDLLAYSRTNTTEREFEITSLTTIIDEVKDELKEELNEKQATIEASELCDVNVIPFQFRQLLHNLIGNALKYSLPDKPPHIIIKSEIAEGIKLNNKDLLPQKKYCHIAVSDNGIGFEQQYSEKIFELFQRLHGRNEYTGTGIGLSIVKKIIENHQGIITANGELNKGATFDIYIPAL